MKKIALSFAVLGTVFAGPAFAKEKTTTTTTKTTTHESHESHQTAHPTRTSASGGSSSLDLAVGFSTFGGASVGGGIDGPAVSGKFNVGNAGSVQALFSIASSNPFVFSVGGVYRHRVLGDGDPGFHLGAGFTLGDAGGFFVNLFPLAGFHFSLGGALKRITLTFDGGVNFHVTPGFQLQAGPLSAVGGGAIHYQL